jgi:hypothetical protein
MHPDRSEVLVHTDKDAELELWTARQDKKLFERELGLPIEFMLAPADGTPLGVLSSPGSLTNGGSDDRADTVGQ